MSSDMGLALFKAVALGLGLGVFYLVAHLASKIFKKLGTGLNKLGEGLETAREKVEGTDENN